MPALRYRLLDGALLVFNGVPTSDDGLPHEERSAGTTVEKARAVLDQRLPALDRCLAARALPSTILGQLVSASYAANLRRAARHLHPALHDRIRQLGIPMRALHAIAAAETRDDQAAAIAAWESDRLERLGRPRTAPNRPSRRRGPMGARDRRVLDRLKQRHGARALRRMLIDDDS